MSSRPTPPTQAPEQNRLDNVSPAVGGHSASMIWALEEGVAALYFGESTMRRWESAGS